MNKYKLIIYSDIVFIILKKPILLLTRNGKTSHYFFMTHGSAALLSNKRGSVFIKLISLLFAIIFFNYSAYTLDNSFSLLSIFLNDITNPLLIKFFYYKYLGQFISVFFGLISVFLIMYSININLKYY